MKHTLLIALLGATITLATPTLSFADNGYIFKSGELKKHQLLLKKRQQQAKHKQRFVAKKPVKTTRKVVKNNHGHTHKHGSKAHNHTKKSLTQHASVKKHSHNNNPTFSISWNVGNSTVALGNHSYVNNKPYNNHNGYRQQEVKRIYTRIHNQSNRIQSGIKNGQLVDREVSKLRQEQKQIKNTMSHYKRDGRVNRYERSRLNQLLDVAKQNIQQKSSNHRTRYSQQQRHNNYNKHHKNDYNNVTYYVQF